MHLFHMLACPLLFSPQQREQRKAINKHAGILCLSCKVFWIRHNTGGCVNDVCGASPHVTRVREGKVGQHGVFVMDIKSHPV